MKILLMNGPNLDMLGVREPEIYGKDTLADLEQLVVRYALERGIDVTCYQSNHEGDLIEAVHAAQGVYDGIVYNPGAHTHYSYALRDAVASVDVPVVEVHISDIDAREDFRRISVIAPVCVAQVKGLGLEGYCRAVDILSAHAAEGEGKAAGERDGELGDAIPFAEAPAEPAAALQQVDESGIDKAVVSLMRIAKVRAECAREGIDLMCVRDTSNIRWLTAFDDVFDEERAHCLTISANRAVLHTDSRYATACEQAAAGGGIEIDSSRRVHMALAVEMLGTLDAPTPVMGIEDDIAVAEYRVLENQFAEQQATGTVQETKDLVKKLRAVKDALEVARLRAAQAITDDAFDHILGFMRPGMTEREVQIELEDFMVRHGAEGLAFPSIVACGPNAAAPHAIPGETRLQEGQCVVLDFGARAYGYCSDMTRIVFLGQPSDELRAAYAAIRDANEMVEALLRPGITGKQAHQMAEDILAAYGFGGKMGHGLGHGVGLDIHEEPCLNTRNDQPLVAGNVVTVEPGIYLPGKFGMRLEDFGIVTDDGFEVFTRSTHEMVVI